MLLFTVFASTFKCADVHIINHTLTDSLYTVGWDTFKDKKFLGFHEYLQNLENIYLQSCIRSSSFTGYYFLILENVSTKYSVFSGVAKVGNGWAQAQPIISSAQPIFMSIVQPIYMHLST